MSKVAVVYWSGTGNTEAMAAKVAEHRAPEQMYRHLQHRIFLRI